MSQRLSNKEGHAGFANSVCSRRVVHADFNRCALEVKHTRSVEVLSGNAGMRSLRIELTRFTGGLGSLGSILGCLLSGLG
jgi:hypothetical protein